jgi:hypothetical protein
MSQARSQNSVPKRLLPEVRPCHSLFASKQIVYIGLREPSAYRPSNLKQSFQVPLVLRLCLEEYQR